MEEKSKKKRKGGKLILIGVLAIASALGLVLFNLWDSNRAAKASNEIVAQLDAVIPEERHLPSGPVIEEAPTREEEEQQKKEKEKVPPMPTIEVDGYFYIGELDIPDLGLHLPVMAEWDLDRLKVSPCHYSGSYYTDDLVILAHNYLRHFSLIKWIDIGAKIYFTNVEGVVYEYEVSNRTTLEPQQVTEMIANQNNSNDEDAEDWDLTLFTCNTGGATRCAVRCIRVE
ncbi:MAG: sortase, partial [Lachnospiraceae bacterium]|nr:sortase [Lachnospiraceae bacterium]